ncbi:hypothetical protein [Paracnuella aquatica]|uniref:hypothetical protein n=1 Tax=Paracnuella aquatica TaxID=2268757 RepID=UPI000F50E5F8|nr:hypothetical protein [Paracnuella aquatica]RPD43649.1 hypothetical protein DRJ53_19550 [Paracnuella aquatica]
MAPNNFRLEVPLIASELSLFNLALSHKKCCRSNITAAAFFVFIEVEPSFPFFESIKGIIDRIRHHPGQNIKLIRELRGIRQDRQAKAFVIS